ncbi:hypothetical protein [Salinisphaera sp. T31B1]|uniref:hypothetical protein n=1 Tax=Salinisphaera sp. T31B1 TaxID=727963 RepID=UPI00334099BC
MADETLTDPCAGACRARPHGRLIAILITTLVSMMIAGCSEPAPTRATETAMIPWLAADGRYGFVDAQGQSLVSARFSDAVRGEHGYAVAAIDETHYGVLDAAGDTVLAFDYPVVELVETGRAPLAITKQEYNAWWRIWDWRLMPEFNILSTRHSGPMLVTRVPRAVWAVRNLATGRVLYRTDTRDDWGPDGRQYWHDRWVPDRTVPEDVAVTAWPDGDVGIRHTLYKPGADGRLEKRVDHIVGRLGERGYLQRSGSVYFHVNDDGRRLDARRFTRAEAIEFTNADGATVHIGAGRVRPPADAPTDVPVLRDDAGRFYLFPELSQPLPTTLTDYTTPDGQVIGAAEIAEQAWFVQWLEHSSRVLIAAALDRSPDDAPSDLYTLLLTPDSGWDAHFTLRKGIRAVTDRGEVIFDRSPPRGVLDPDLVFHRVPMQRISTLPDVDHLYIGTDHQGRSGVYDAAAGRWRFRSADRVVERRLDTGPLVYSQRRDGHDSKRLGLLDFDTGEPITPALYSRIEPDGRIVRYGHDRARMFYIDTRTGREFRER